MITSQQVHCLGIVQLDGVDQQHTLNREHASVDVVAKKQIFSVGRVSSHVQQLLQVEELSMDVTNDCDRVSQLHEIGFLAQNGDGVVQNLVTVLFRDLTFLVKVRSQCLPVWKSASFGSRPRSLYCWFHSSWEQELGGQRLRWRWLYIFLDAVFQGILQRLH